MDNRKFVKTLLSKSCNILNESTVKQRILALRLLEKQKKNPELAKQLGINVRIKEKNNSDDKNKSQNESIAILLTEAALLLNEGVSYTVEGRNELYADGKFIGTFGNSVERHELEKEYEEELKNKEENKCR